MPHEKRLIIFNEREIREALLMHLAGNHNEARNKIAEICIGEGTTVIVKYDDDDSPDVEVTAGSLCAAFLRYCKANSIPIPQRGAKSLRRSQLN